VWRNPVEKNKIPDTHADENYISVLRKMVLEEKDLNKPFDYFFGLMGKGIRFDDRPVSDISKNIELSTVIRSVAHSLAVKLNIDARVESTMLYEVPAHGLFHGVCMLAGSVMPVTLLYFSPVQTGIFAIASTGNTDMFRFSLAKMTDHKKLH
jgi:hypothetical protein